MSREILFNEMLVNVNPEEVSKRGEMSSVWKIKMWI